MLAQNYTSIDPKQFFKHRARLQRPNLGAKMNAKETDQWACNVNVVGCAMVRKNFSLLVAKPRVAKVQMQRRTKSGHMVVTWWMHGRRMHS